MTALTSTFYQKHQQLQTLKQLETLKPTFQHTQHTQHTLQPCQPTQQQQIIKQHAVKQQTVKQHTVKQTQEQIYGSKFSHLKRPTLSFLDEVERKIKKMRLDSKALTNAAESSKTATISTNPLSLTASSPSTPSTSSSDSISHSFDGMDSKEKISEHGFDLGRLLFSQEYQPKLQAILDQNDGSKKEALIMALIQNLVLMIDTGYAKWVDDSKIEHQQFKTQQKQMQSSQHDYFL